MRLLNNSNTRSLFESLNDESIYNIESREQAVERAAEEIFDGSDFFLNDASYKEDTSGNTNGWVTFNVTAYGGEPDKNGEIELNRDVVLPIKYNGYVEETKGLDLDDFYTLVSETLTDWVNTHNSPDSFYNESVTIDTGSTTITSDETGVTVEDNGNTITSGNGVTVNVDNTQDILPAEMDIAEPTEELPLDGAVEEVPAEDIENVEPTEEIDEPTEDTEEDDEDLDKSAVNEEVLEKPTEENEEEINNSKVEECDKSDKKDEKIEEATSDDFEYAEEAHEIAIKELAKKYNADFDELMSIIDSIGYDDDEDIPEITKSHLNKSKNNNVNKALEAWYNIVKNLDTTDCNWSAYADDELLKDVKLEEADGYNQNQNVEIYQNPEFDYQILDITELDNTDTGDVRAIDMANILNDLDESLTEALGTNNWGEINSFLTRKGTHKKTNESYSSAILELTLPRLNESIGEYKNVFMLEVYGDKALKECVVRNSKSQIIKEYCGKTKDPVKHFEGVIFDIMNSRKLKEEVVPMVNEPYEDGGMNFADGRAIEKDEERQENHLKQHDARNKETKKFKIEKEPNQDNTTGKTEEELTDTTEVEALPKAKKTKVDAKKLKVKEIKESYSIDELKDLIERLLDEAREYPENNPGSLYSQAIRELKDSGIDSLADYLSECYDRCDSSYIRGSHVIEDLKYVLSKLSDMNESAKLNEAEDELLDEPIVTDGTEPEDELQESGSDVAIFHRKPQSVKAMRAAEQNGITVNKSNYKIVGTKELSGKEFEDFANHLKSEKYDWLKEYNDTSKSGEFKCVEVINTDDDSYTLLVDPQGRSSARYVAIKDKLNDEEELLEPEEELLDEPVEEPTEEVNENE